MANLPEQPNYEEGIYQIELTDPVVGGPGGISNRQAQQLANRTRYLFEQIKGMGKTTWQNVTGKPSVFPPAAHRHSAADLDINWSNLPGRPTAFPPAAHNHALANIDTKVIHTAVVWAPANVVVDANGKLSRSTYDPTVRAVEFLTASKSVAVPGWARRALVEVQAAGGGGGATNLTSKTACGGGAGALARGLYNVTPGATIACTIGKGGAGAAASTTANGVKGGDSAFGAYLKCAGGSGGSRNNIGGGGQLGNAGHNLGGWTGQNGSFGMEQSVTTVYAGSLVGGAGGGPFGGHTSINHGSNAGGSAQPNSGCGGGGSPTIYGAGGNGADGYISITWLP
ncbi:hypothetical protein PSH28_18405 [Pseudomonas resinovorans]|uniref:glycine-rich domain-containing protein n=1 Tax=Metapseudomonas resinovorans TaxID=53412 RepID=UPI00237F42A6|nr:hypothetical protein [Pseudomonas resinovorans]MDE3738581.1 hypothetical protein [Pseudomonas resinovorans]